MTAWGWVALVVAGGLGAAARHLLDAVTPRPRSGFPLGILVVNVAGSLLLGLLAGLGTAWFDATWTAILGAGLLGGFTTFSTVSVDSALLAQRRAHLIAAANLVATVGAAVAAAAGGWAVGRLLAGA